MQWIWLLFFAASATCSLPQLDVEAATSRDTSSVVSCEPLEGPASASRVLLQSQSELIKAENSSNSTAAAVLEVLDDIHPTHSNFLEHFFGAVGLLLTVSLTIYLKYTVEDYEEKSSANSPPWFCDENIIFQVGGGFVLAWVLIGVMAFTQVLHFTVMGKERVLTVLEALYVCAEILTTVGYGDLSPSSYASQAFCAVYSIFGCSIIAVVFSLIFNHCLGTQRHLVPLTHPAVAAATAHSRPRYKGAVSTLRPVLLALAMGTVFFAYYPGEDKTPWLSLGREMAEPGDASKGCAEWEGSESTKLLENVPMTPMSEESPVKAPVKAMDLLVPRIPRGPKPSKRRPVTRPSLTPVFENDESTETVLKPEQSLSLQELSDKFKEKQRVRERFHGKALAWCRETSDDSQAVRFDMDDLDFLFDDEVDTWKRGATV